MLIIAAFAIYVIVAQRVRITHTIALTGRNARDFGIALLVTLLPLMWVINAVLSLLLPASIRAVPPAVRVIALILYASAVVLMARWFWKREPLRCGQRVRVSATHPWAKEANGLIAYPPPSVVAAGGWSGCSRQAGALRFRWVMFDVPQLDANGNGPHHGGEIDARYLETV